MMRNQLKHFLATVSVFLVSIGLMGATPKKSQAFVICAFYVGSHVYCFYKITQAHCGVPPGCAISPATGNCLIAGWFCGGPSAAFPCTCGDIPVLGGCNCNSL
jgi:hypothetical protein